MNFTRTQHCNAAFLRVLAILLLLAAPTLLYAQGDVTAIRTKAEELMEASKMIEAIPVLEQWIAADPKAAKAYEHLGYALLGKRIHTIDPSERKQLNIRARNAFIRSQELGNDTNLIRALIGSLPADGSEGAAFSENPRSQALTVAGERAFTGGKIDEAIDLYKQAAAADTKNYFAALFAGDMYLKKEDYGNAETWYQKAIAIDPYKETAYRYSATPLMRQQKYEQALERYIEAWITDPYSRFAVNGIIQWGQVTSTGLGHPKIDIPKTTVGADGKENTTINVNPLSDDGSMAWIAYSATREVWKKEKFAKTFPNEKPYRHTTAEEVDALRSVVSMAKTLKSKSLSPQIAILEKLDKEGLLDAFVLMAIPDQGIAKDHPAYLRANRDKLRQYVRNYVIQKK